jgi:hypothetical protein
MSFFHDKYTNCDSIGHIFRIKHVFAVAFDRYSLRMYMFGKRLINWSNA